MCASWTCSFAKSSQPREWATASVVAAKTLVIHATGATQVVSAIKVLSERVLNGFKASAHMAFNTDLLVSLHGRSRLSGVAWHIKLGYAVF